ncbi:unnamed protein product (macronuclear) [Paramecium tetraurelia]|uniref:Uncharacterized protein n=1 Tax=Paramecium tetraurelia TaxID=5888 RepID=A0ECY7_PARTE|nr:uncharacterized protein GSPATT00004023001 [Paramecium tetraurelia]CAK93154.1 unnamed protein product [Paramecium tetraurelia]|eukprot:XP_001460551.1 hypothetical protein (macronuclear) [Paramecium tetraurelia strain d4-2]
MIDRRSQSPMATSQKMGTARAIFDTGTEQEPTKRLTRSIRNTSTDPQQTDQKQQYQNQLTLGVQGSYELNSQNSRQFTQENFDYRKPETDTLNFRTVQTYKPQEVSAQPITQFNYQSFEYKKPDAGRTGSYIQSAYNTTFQEPIGSSLNYQNKSVYEPPKQDNTFTKYELNPFDKYKTTFEQPKTYDKFEQYKFEPMKYDFNIPEQPKDRQPSYRSIPQVQPNQSVIQTQYTPYNPDRITLDTQLNRTTLNYPLQNESLSVGPRKTEEPKMPSDYQIKTQKPVEPIKTQNPPSIHAESIKNGQVYRPTTPVYTQQQQYQLSGQKLPESQFKQEPVDMFNKPSYKCKM